MSSEKIMFSLLCICMTMQSLTFAALSILNLPEGRAAVGSGRERRFCKVPPSCGADDVASCMSMTATASSESSESSSASATAAQWDVEEGSSQPTGGGSRVKFAILRSGKAQTSGVVHFSLCTRPKTSEIQA